MSILKELQKRGWRLDDGDYNSNELSSYFENEKHEGFFLELKVIFIKGLETKAKMILSCSDITEDGQEIKDCKELDKVIKEWEKEIEKQTEAEIKWYEENVIEEDYRGCEIRLENNNGVVSYGVINPKKDEFILEGKCKMSLDKTLEKVKKLINTQI